MQWNRLVFAIAVVVACVCAAPQSGMAAADGGSAILAGLDEHDRANARIGIELTDDARSADHIQARMAEELWMAGDDAGAIAVIRGLEAVVGVDIGIDWKTPKPSDATRFGDDVRLGTRSSATMVALDHDAASGNFFAVVHWDETPALWSVFLSTDRGASWAETYSWGTSAWADGVVAGNWFWVGYQSVSDLSNGRIRRFSLADGSVDAVYGYQTVVDLAGDLDEIVVFSNADQFDNRIFYTFMADDGSMRLFFDDSSSGTSFEESWSASPVVDAASGLDWHWNQDSLLDRYAFCSYLGTDGAIHVWLWSGGWTEMDTIAGYSGLNGKTKISAHADTVIVAFEEEDLPNYDIVYRISYNGGDSWADGHPTPDGLSFDFDVTARGGIGTALIYGRETGEPDEIDITSRAGYGPGGWTEPEIVNQHDIATGDVDMEINWLGDDYGVLYTDAAGIVWFDQPGLIFSDDFESGNTSLWDTTAP